ncbi:MAG: 30S ribosomal protein S13, partial [Pseudomonadota bacterium]
TAKKILAECNIDPITKVKDLTDEQINSINRYIEANVTVEGDLRRIVKGKIKDLIAEGRYRGLCHRIGKPVRGQNWHSNGKTARKRAGKA